MTSPKVIKHISCSTPLNIFVLYLSGPVQLVKHAPTMLGSNKVI